MMFDMITPKELEQYLNQKNVVIIDLRASDEYVAKHIKGAINIPYEHLGDCCMFPKNITLIFYCDRGAMSMVSAKEFARKGYHTKTVVGGFLAYQGKETESFR